MNPCLRKMLNSLKYGLAVFDAEFSMNQNQNSNWKSN